jgi:hypothetical protein
MGFGEEFETGDGKFDRKIFIISDDDRIGTMLAGDAKVRELVGELLPAKVYSIWITGEVLRFRIPGDGGTEEILEAFKAIYDPLVAMQQRIGTEPRDPFYRRAILAESIAWGVTGYAMVTFFGAFGDLRRPLSSAIVAPGVMLGVLVSLVLLVCLKLFLGKSSRTPQILFECAILLFLAMPLVGIQVLIDLNAAFDSSTGLQVVRQVHGTDKKTQKRCKIIRVPDAADGSLPFDLPASIFVGCGMYSQLKSGGYLLMEIGEGYLGYPWFRDLKVYTGPLKAPGGNGALPLAAPAEVAIHEKATSSVSGH